MRNFSRSTDNFGNSGKHELNLNINTLYFPFILVAKYMMLIGTINM